MTVTKSILLSHRKFTTLGSAKECLVILELLFFLNMKLNLNKLILVLKYTNFGSVGHCIIIAHIILN